MKKKLICSFVIAVLITLGIFLKANAQNTAPVYFFWGNGCPHCAQEKFFLDNLKKENPKIEINDYEVYQNQANLDLLVEIGKQTGADVRGVPFLVVGDQIIIGYLNDKSTGEQIKKAIDVCLAQGCRDIVRPILQEVSTGMNSSTAASSETVTSNTTVTDTVIPREDEMIKSINLPFLGELAIASVSLPVLTVILGALDGFNPCAMWTLVFLISLLLGMSDRRRMWFLGTSFIIASASVYFVFMAAWLNLILFLGFIFWLRLLIALVALGGGAYNIKDFIYNKEGTCKVSGAPGRQKVFTSLKAIAGKQSLFLAFFGIIALAFVVNLVELICSAGLPAVYTQILAINNLPTWQYYLYIFIYILVFMLDDLFVFFAAMVTLKLTGLSTKYSRYSRLVGGAIMIIIGLLMLFNPGWLMFG